MPSHPEEAFGAGAEEKGCGSTAQTRLGAVGVRRGSGGPGRRQSLWTASGMGLTKPKPGIHCGTLLSLADTPAFSFTSSGAIFTKVQDK